jgi:hypothetical protein
MITQRPSRGKGKWRGAAKTAVRLAPSIAFT